MFRIPNSEQFRGAKFYNNVIGWKLTELELRKNGYPRPDSVPGRAVLFIDNTPESPPQRGNVRTCCRCKKEYTVGNDGFAVVNEKCTYHYKRLFKRNYYSKYPCCDGSSTSAGCRTVDCHVYFNKKDDLEGFVKTQPKANDDDPGVYAIDCEMSYTTRSIELTKVTIVDSSCNVVYDTFVKPSNPIIEYNKEFSGVSEEVMKLCTTTLADVHAKLLELFSDKTIVVGHSLDSDFLALKLLHHTVIDTSALYPHKLGLPYKRALRNLAMDFLGKEIQVRHRDHDSAEDATVCMNLLMVKLKNKLRL